MNDILTFCTHLEPEHRAEVILALMAAGAAIHQTQPPDLHRIIICFPEGTEYVPTNQDIPGLPAMGMYRTPSNHVFFWHDGDRMSHSDLSLGTPQEWDTILFGQEQRAQEEEELVKMEDEWLHNEENPHLYPDRLY